MKMAFGKYKGMTMEEIVDENPEYIVWLHENVETYGDLNEFVTNNYKTCKKKVEFERELLLDAGFDQAWDYGAKD